ncbi:MULTISPECIES: YdcF family protein [Sphingomonadales]|uniref:YdcF family protein n=1 Tax=Alteriqipengyuania abyssalis TaxID=2860200 RepID=A0ABS7PHX7_9SPHN|nr:YdcF family protein [Alteriqipengyuania abyssalis]MCD1623271.1 YdcF family protein [Citromicrobium bathyomarinum]
MIWRVGLAIVLVWVLGFIWFAGWLPGPAPMERTDAVIVPTGYAGRIERGLEVVQTDSADTLLVTGVDPEVKPGEFAAQFKVPEDVMECCVTLGFAATDTRGNAQETREWVEAHGIKSLRLVTSDWHMRRAATELRRQLPGDVKLIKDAVRSEPSLWLLLIEYHKWLVSRTVGPLFS